MNTLPPDLPREADTIVVGGGTGGAALDRLWPPHSTQTPARCSRPALTTGLARAAAGRTTSSTLAAIPLSHDWGLNTGTSIPGRVLDLPRARIIGGCSSHNGCTASRRRPRRLRRLGRPGNPGWASADVEPLLAWVHRALPGAPLPMDELTAPQAAFVQRGAGSGPAVRRRP